MRGSRADPRTAIGASEPSAKGSTCESVRSCLMKTYPVTLLQLSALTGTRAIAGAGLGLLLADHVPPEQRKPFGWSVFCLGVGLYVTLVADLLLRNRDRLENTD